MLDHVWSSKPPMGWPIDRTHPLSGGLVLALAFNEGAGATAYDGSGDANNGTFGSAAAWKPGLDGWAAKVSGAANNYVQCANNASLQFTGPFSFFARFRPDATPSTSTIAWAGNTGSNPQWRIRLSSATTIDFTIFTATGHSITATVPSMATGSWHTIAAVYSAGGSWTGYLDGHVAGTPLSGITGSPASTMALALGARADLALNFFNGAIDIARAWNRALSLSEIAALHSNPWQVHLPPRNRTIFVGFFGSAAVALGGLSVSAAGTSSTSGSASDTLGSLIVAAAGSYEADGSSVASLARLIPSASGAFTATAVAAANLSPSPISAAGTFANSAVATMTAARMSVAGAGTFTTTASASGTLGGLVVAATPFYESDASSAASLARLIPLASGTFAATTAASATLSPLAASTAGTFSTTAAATLTAGSISVVGLGTFAAVASAATSLGPLAADGFAAPLVPASMSVSLGGLLIAASGSMVIPASMSASLGGLSIAATTIDFIPNSSHEMIDPGFIRVIRARGHAPNAIVDPTATVEITSGPAVGQPVPPPKPTAADPALESPDFSFTALAALDQ